MPHTSALYQLVLIERVSFGSDARSVRRLNGVETVPNDGQLSFWRLTKTVSPHGLPTYHDPVFDDCNITFSNIVGASGEVRPRSH